MFWVRAKLLALFVWDGMLFIDGTFRLIARYLSNPQFMPVN